MFKFYSMIFYLGIFTSIYGGVGLKLGFVESNLASLFAVMGLIGTGMGYAGRYYFIRKNQIEKGITRKKPS